MQSVRVQPIIMPSFSFLIGLLSAPVFPSLSAINLLHLSLFVLLFVPLVFVQMVDNARGSHDGDGDDEVREVGFSASRWSPATLDESVLDHDIIHARPPPELRDFVQAYALPSVRRMNEVPFHVRVYISHTSLRRLLDPYRFSRMRFAGNLTKSIRVAGHDNPVNTSVGAWDARWAHWGRRGVSVIPAQYRQVIADTIYVRCSEEAEYVTVLDDMLVQLYASEDVYDNACLGLVCLSQPYDNMWYAHEGPRSADHWGGDIDFEWRMRTHSRRQLFVSWHNVEVHALHPADRPQVYATVPSWWGDYEPSRIINCPNPPFFSYASGLVLKTQGSSFIHRAPPVARPLRAEQVQRMGMTIALSEFAVAAVIRFLMTVREWVVSPRAAIVDPRMVQWNLEDRGRTDIDTRAITGVITPIPAKLDSLIRSMGLFNIIAGTRFDLAKSVMAFHRATELDWGVAAGMRYPFFLYDFDTGDVASVPEATARDEKGMRQTLPAVSVRFYAERRITMAECQALADAYRERQNRPNVEPPEPVLPRTPMGPGPMDMDISGDPAPITLPPSQGQGPVGPSSMVVGPAEPSSAVVSPGTTPTAGGVFRPRVVTAQPGPPSGFNLEYFNRLCTDAGLNGASSEAVFWSELPILVQNLGQFYDLEKTAAGLRTEAGSLRVTVGQQMAELDKLRGTNAQQAKELETLRAEADGLKTRCTQALAERDALREGQDGLRGQLSANRTERTNLEADRDRLQAELDAKTKELASVRSEADSSIKVVGKRAHESMEELIKRTQSNRHNLVQLSKVVRDIFDLEGKDVEFLTKQSKAMKAVADSGTVPEAESDAAPPKVARAARPSRSEGSAMEVDTPPEPEPAPAEGPSRPKRTKGASSSKPKSSGKSTKRA